MISPPGPHDPNRPLIVRSISAAESEGFLRLASAYREWYGGPSVGASQNADFFRRFLHPSELGVWLGASLSGSPAGFATLYWTHSSIAAVDIALLNDLYVKPEHRGLGIGRALIEGAASAARARGLSRLDWFTSPENVVAQRLYDRTGAHRSEWIEYSLDVGTLA